VYLRPIPHHRPQSQHWILSPSFWKTPSCSYPNPTAPLLAALKEYILNHHLQSHSHAQLFKSLQHRHLLQSLPAQHCRLQVVNRCRPTSSAWTRRGPRRRRTRSLILISLVSLFRFEVLWLMELKLVNLYPLLQSRLPLLLCLKNRPCRYHFPRIHPSLQLWTQGRLAGHLGFTTA